MAGGDYFYEGANYGFDPEYGGTSQAYSQSQSAGIGLATDARTANVLKEISSKLNTGATTIEVTQVFPEVFESIPKEHFKELNRLRKLVGDKVELTLHAPIIEPTGMGKQGWSQYSQQESERQMLNALEKAHSLNEKGNIVTTFHASAMQVPAESVAWEEAKDGSGKKVRVLRGAVVIDERTGEALNLPYKQSVLEGEEKFDIKQKLDRMNREQWFKTLEHVNFAADQGTKTMEAGLSEGIRNAGPESEEAAKEGRKVLMDIYKDYANGNVEKVEEKMKEWKEKVPPEFAFKAAEIKESLSEISHGDVYIRNAYSGLREMFDQAYESLQRQNTAEAKEKLERLEKFKKEIQPKLKYYESPEGVDELAEKIREGTGVLRSVGAAPVFRPLREFAIEKSAETFGNAAFKAFNEYGEHTPIISIENPPAGQGILHTGEDLKDLIEATRKKFVENAVKSNKFSEGQAKEEAKKLIGATWDVGHINMLRKYGAGEKELVEQTRKVAPMIKHIHLSDNFGMEHTELPMGMGNVPISKMMDEIKEEGKKAKKIVEALNWYQHFQTSPLGDTLRQFGSPIYAMENAPYWNKQGYFSGYGMNPEVHHSMYGAGFANLPVELGGQMTGKSRVSGNPID